MHLLTLSYNFFIIASAICAYIIHLKIRKYSYFEQSWLGIYSIYECSDKQLLHKSPLVNHLSSKDYALSQELCDFPFTHTILLRCVRICNLPLNSMLLKKFYNSCEVYLPARLVRKNLIRQLRTFSVRTSNFILDFYFRK